MHRRHFVKTAGAGLAMSLVRSAVADENRGNSPRVMTVTGEVAADQLGGMLPHEHVMVDFVGADQVSPDRYDAGEVVEVLLPHVKRAKELGCRAIAECTPAYLGRDPELLKRLSQASEVRLLTNTGYYGARQGKFLPKHAHRESADELANRWTAEWNNGIGRTGIRPGFIKIGVDAGPLTDVNRKLVEAAARCHLETGLTIAGHTGDGKAALEQIDVLRKEGASPSSWIWVHAQNERNHEIHLEVGRRGAWVEFDGVGPSSIARHVELVQNMRRADLLGRVLVSHDAGWYSVGEPRGGKVRGYDTLFTQFLPALNKAGFSEEEIRQLTVHNPARAFSISVRSTGDDWGRGLQTSILFNGLSPFKHGQAKLKFEVPDPVTTSHTAELLIEVPDRCELVRFHSLDFQPGTPNLIDCRLDCIFEGRRISIEMHVRHAVARTERAVVAACVNQRVRSLFSHFVNSLQDQGKFERCHFLPRSINVGTYRPRDEFAAHDLRDFAGWTILRFDSLRAARVGKTKCPTHDPVIRRAASHFVLRTGRLAECVCSGVASPCSRLEIVVIFGVSLIAIIHLRRQLGSGTSNFNFVQRPLAVQKRRSKIEV